MSNAAEQQNENIQLSLPVNAAYVSAARLTASSIANRMRFDIDEIEDIKAAVSEACTFIIKNAPAANGGEFTIAFKIEKDVLKTTITAKADMEHVNMETEMGLVMIHALMDEFSVEAAEVGGLHMLMVKRHKNITFD